MSQKVDCSQSPPTNELANILSSDSSTKCWSDRIKQETTAAKSLAVFFNKLAATEEEKAKAHQRALRQMLETAVRGDAKGGTYLRALQRLGAVNDSLVDSALTFANDIRQNAEELLNAMRIAEKNRRLVKDSAVKQDKHVLDLEASRNKAHAKHDSLLQDRDRMSNLELQSSKKSSFAFKTGRTQGVGKQLDELVSKLAQAESELGQRQDEAVNARRELQLCLRPQMNTQFKEIMLELSTFIQLQLTTYARSLEARLLRDALAVAPNPPSVESLMAELSKINVNADFDDYLQACGNDPDATISSLARQDEPNHYGFGLSIEAVPKSVHGVPLIMLQCLSFIESRDLNTEGLYRVSPAIADVATARTSLAQGHVIEEAIALVHGNLHVATAVLKQFLIELPNPLLVPDTHEPLVAAARLPLENERRVAIHQVINDLPDASYSALRALVLHLDRIQRFAKTNMMNIRNLAVVLAPTLVGDAIESVYQVLVVETIITHCHSIFEAS